MNRNLRLGLICVLVFTGMVGAAYAAVPLYRLFCQKTGFAGATRRAEKASGVILSRKVTVSFDTNVRGLPWTFAAAQTKQDVRIGDTSLAYFTVTNTGKVPLTGRAAYNVVPDGAGAYFTKLECFCFTNQTLQPGETKSFPVAYYVDPAMAKDVEANDIKDITLSYTFYPAVGVQPASTKSVSISGAKPLGGKG